MGSPAFSTPQGWWQACGCGCSRSHKVVWGQPLCPHTEADLGGEPVPWVIDPDQRCGECLLISDDEVTARTRAGAAKAQAEFLEFLDAGLAALQRQLDDQARAADLLDEGGES